MKDALFALVAIKDPARGKSRLASLLSPAERLTLARWFAHRVLDCCARALSAGQIVVITPCEAIADKARDYGMHVLRETVFGDVNATVSEAARYAIAAGAQSLLFVPADLPQLTPQSILAVANRLERERGCVIVPDHHGTGTNVLGMAPPQSDFFRFGEGSFERHCRLALEVGFKITIHKDPALMFDIDTPQDYRLWRSMSGAKGRTVAPPDQRI
jgi:2-phospho-L-lactate guanylyltransferase